MRVFDIDPEANVTFLYHDDQPDLGPVNISRAAHVEPMENGRGWSVKFTRHEVHGRYKGYGINLAGASRKVALEVEEHMMNHQLLSLGKE